MSTWFNYEASLKILVFGLVLGSGLPALFALGVRAGAAGAGVEGSDGTAVGQKNPALTATQLVVVRVGAGRGRDRRAVRRPGFHRGAHRHVHPGSQARVASGFNL